MWLIAGCPSEPAPTPQAEHGVLSPGPAEKRTATAPANGFNDNIAWRGFDEGFAEASEKSWPLMLVVHTSWCSKCKALKPVFAEPEIEALSERFVMVNVDQDLDTRARGFGPDGQYIPRILFVDPKTGRPDPDLRNGKRKRSQYYFNPTDDIAGQMKKALAQYGPSS